MFSVIKINRAVLTQCIYTDVGNYFMCYLDEVQASQFEQNLTNFD
jgi:hypothetical protein